MGSNRSSRCRAPAAGIPWALVLRAHSLQLQQAWLEFMHSSTSQEPQHHGNKRMLPWKCKLVAVGTVRKLPGSGRSSSSNRSSPPALGKRPFGPSAVDEPLHGQPC
jgi:hypothetical protein